MQVNLAFAYRRFIRINSPMNANDIRKSKLRDSYGCKVSKLGGIVAY